MVNASKYSFCRNCPANCGMAFEVQDNRIVEHRPDKENQFTEGFMCVKGDYAVDFHNGVEDRLTQSLRREGDGFVPVDSETVMDEIAERLEALIARHGPKSVAVFYGTCAYQKALTIPMAKEFAAKIGTPNLFSTMTIDQSAQWVTDGRMGLFATGLRQMEDLDTLVLIGTNPIVSHGSPFMSIPKNNQLKHIKAFRERGGRMVVIDPRRSETAARADVHVQPLPGRDGAIAAGLIRILLERGWHDRAFCDRYVTHLDQLREATAPFTPDRVAAMAGIPVDQLFEIAELLRAPRRVSIGFGTGMTMAPQPNTAAHMVRALNAICGGYIRAGEQQRNPGALVNKATIEMVIPPTRSWEAEPKLRSGHGRLYGEFPTSRLPHEIMEDGPEQIRALIVVGGNPLAAIGQTAFVRTALEKLDLLIVIDPRMTETAGLADYVVAPPLQFEVHDFNSFGDFVSDRPFLQYSPPVVEPPVGTIEEWRFFNGVANRLGHTLEVKPFAFSSDAAAVPQGMTLAADTAWTTDQLIDAVIASTGFTCADLLQHPHGLQLDLPRVIVAAPQEDDGVRLDLCPPDVAAEVLLLLDAEAPQPGDYLLITRRLVDTMNSAYRHSPRVRRRSPNNSLFMNPDDIAREGLAAGDAVTLSNTHGSIVAHVKADASLRPGIVAMTHCRGSIDPGSEADGNVGRLVSIATDAVAVIDAMPQHSALPIRLSPARHLAATAA